MRQEKTILRDAFIHVRVRCVGERRDDFLAKLFVGRPVLRGRNKRGQPVIVILISRLEREE